MTAHNKAQRLIELEGSTKAKRHDKLMAIFGTSSFALLLLQSFLSGQLATYVGIAGGLAFCGFIYSVAVRIRMIYLAALPILVMGLSVGTASTIQSNPVRQYPVYSDPNYHSNFARWLKDNNGTPEAITWNLERR